MFMAHLGMVAAVCRGLLNLCVVELKGVLPGGVTLDLLWYCCGEGVAAWRFTLQ